MGKCRYIWGSLALPVFFLADRGAFAQPIQTAGPRFVSLWHGDCTLEGDDIAPLSLCLKGHAEAAALRASNTEGQYNFKYYGASLYSGVHMSHFLSVHWRGRAAYNREQSDIPNERLRSNTEQLLLQVGNPAFSSVWATAGYGDLPFGIYPHAMMRVTDETLGTTLFPDRSRLAQISMDNGRNCRLEIAASTPTVDGKHDFEIRKDRDSQSDGVTARFSQDLPELYATRVVTSWHSVRTGSRVLGIAILNESPKGETTVLEYVRSRSDLNDISSPDAVEVRASYQGDYIEGTRFNFVIDDRSDKYRTGILGGDFRWREIVMFRLAVGYIKAESDNIRSRWFAAVGTEADL